ncbi:response regulator [Mangrovimonas sp. AS39]|uniref:hybrid sensor histidine kinase/response regulator transcription factor n=1 Tax=Mangrovimonas futianensis TaxID=2895523 RepID=UPI001E2F0A10|nr:two-component regulator propeller domain-containing protein [Mangrovimonas futianensis]MCF1192317.1 response regulator [Mangrovimonas futianensis]MCF1195934.1 response regulator [Mangrovimonas futianensis]
MTNFFRQLLLSGIISLVGFYLNAQVLEIEKLGIENGLSNNNVVSITQDNDGFIWIATKDGLNRFDSNTFKVFTSSESESNTICSNVLNHVYADKFDDVIWIASEKNGVDSYNYKSHIFTHYEHDYDNPEINDLSANGVTRIDGDDKGNIWFATYDQGIDILDKKTNQFTNFNTSNTPGLGSNYNWYVMYDTEEKIYVGHVMDGFSIINSKTKTAINYKHDPKNPNSLADNTVTSILKDKKDRIWIGTRNGLTLFNPISERMVTFRNDPKNPNSISSNFIQKMFETKDNELYIGTEGGGLNILHLNDLNFDSDSSSLSFFHINASETPEGLTSQSVQTVIQDTFGNIWLGGLGGGINFIPSRKSNFHKIVYLPFIGNTNSLNDKPVHSICVDNKNQVWVANGIGGISIYKGGIKTKQIDTILNDSKKQSIISLYRARNEDIWIGTSQGEIFTYSSIEDNFTKLKCFDTLNNTPIYSFFEDKKGQIWIATDLGLHEYNPQTNQCNIFSKSNSELPDNIIRSIAEDGHGNLWVGSLIGGLCVFDKNFKLIKNYGETYDFYAVNQIYKDSKNRMWITSQNDLFLIKENSTDSVLRVSEITGLAEANVRSIVEGKSEKEIWVSTTNGISQIELNTMNISNYDVSDGIVAGDYLFNSVAKTDDNKIYFGSQNGITWFDQNLEPITMPTSEATITKFSTSSNKNFLSEFTDVPFGDNIELDYTQNSFQIGFNILDYSLAHKVEFAYKMDGLNDNWYLDDDNDVTFRNLKPGNYTFNLKARIKNNAWSDKIHPLFIKINPPIWLTWYMKLIYIIIIATMIYYALKFYKKKLKIENDLLLEKKSRQHEQDLNEEKLRFFTNITHELRSPMTLILGPLEDLISEGSFSEEQSKKIHMIHRISSKLLRIVNQILEFRKSENKSRKLSVIKDDLGKYIYEIGDKYKDRAKSNQIDYSIIIPEKKVDVFFDPDVVTIIADNLLSNAFKYTREGSITLELKQCVEDSIEYTKILVSDTGYGISDENLPYIFDRYFQAKNTSHPVKGTGIGLALLKNMVELHEADIDVHSALNEGTEFRVKFLTNNTYPEAVHYYPEEAQIEEIEENSKNLILVVDDDPEIVEYISDSLSDIYNVISAENGKSGFEIASEEIPDIIISDIMMPIMDGLEMCKHLKKDLRTSHIPLVLLTAKGSLHDQKVGYDLGIDSYLTKPFSSNLLKSRLKNILDARQKYSLSNSSEFKAKQELLNESIGELDQEFLKKLTQTIEENLEDEKMNISYVAGQLNMSHSTLYRKIKALTNLTANEFIRKVRINFAEQLLITGQYNVSEIMYQVGINSSSYFRQCFKEEFGLNPSDYLQKLKES